MRLRETQRASIHAKSREGRERQKVRVFLHQPEELAGSSILLSFPAGSVFRHPHALEEPQKPPFILTTQMRVSLQVATIPPQRSSCNLSVTSLKSENHLIAKNILTYFTKHLRKGEEGFSIAQLQPSALPPAAPAHKAAVQRPRCARGSHCLTCALGAAAPSCLHLEKGRAVTVPDPRAAKSPSRR